MKRIKLHHWIVIGMVAGLIVGVSMHRLGDQDSDGFKLAVWWLNLLGKDVFIGSLKMIIAPLIFASIISGITSLPSMQELGAIGWKTFAYYFITTALAVTIGLAAVLIIQPGHKGASLKLRAAREAELAVHYDAFREQLGGQDPLDPGNRPAYMQYIARQEAGLIGGTDFGAKWKRIAGVTGRGPGDMFREDILAPILSNPFDALARTRSLGIIFFAIITGLACSAVGARAQPVVGFFQGLNHVMMKMTLWVMRFAPLAVGCIIASMVATLGISALESLAWYCAAVIVGIAIHVAALLAIVAFIGGMSPVTFLRGIGSAWLVAFTTTSSAATLPVTLRCVIDKLKVSPKVANFGLPVGATVNMDGTALYEGVAIIFMIQMYGGLHDVPIELTAAKTFIIFITAVLASVGAAAVPSAGLITMAIVAGAIGLPLHYISVIFAVDRFLDMFRTSTNVLGDAVGAVVVHRLEHGKLGDEPPPDAEEDGF